MMVLSKRAIDMTGKQYGELTALEPAHIVESTGNIVWRFRCSCGNDCEIDGYSVRKGKSRACQQCGAERTRLASITHGKTSTPEYSTWADIQTRCGNPNYKGFADYGARGIRVCDRWAESFESFLQDMGPRPNSKHSIERNDVNGDYEPGNCRWATATEQALNKRNTRRIEIDGVVKPLSVWATEHGLLPSTIHLRIKAGKTGASLLAPSAAGGTVTYLGITDTHAGWSRRTGIRKSTIAMRLTKYQWPVARALTEGATR